MEGRLTIGKVNASDRDNFISIEIEASGKSLCRVSVPFAAFAEAITGLSTRHCEIQVPKYIADAMAEQWG